MAWMNVDVTVEGGDPVHNVVNIDTIIRYGPKGSGAYIKFVDGTSITVLDSMDEITAVILRAQQKQEKAN